jgi:hypothetical protein
MVYIERLALEQYIERSMGIIETNRSSVLVQCIHIIMIFLLPAKSIHKKTPEMLEQLYQIFKPLSLVPVILHLAREVRGRTSFMPFSAAPR